MGLFFWVTVALLSVPLRVFGWLWEKWHFGASQAILRANRNYVDWLSNHVADAYYDSLGKDE